MSVRTSQTANSEFEFLTGCSMAFLPYRSIPYNSYIKDSMPSLTTTLKDLGYGGNLAFHPGEANAWNRDKIYPLLGFDTFCSFQNIAADLGEEDIVHGFPSDQFGYEYLINQYEQFRLKSAEPFYSFFVTIQNHGGYMQTATFCGQQGRISRTVQAILSGQTGISAGQRVLRPTNQYCSLFQEKAMLSQSVQ